MTALEVLAVLCWFAVACVSISCGTFAQFLFGSILVFAVALVLGNPDTSGDQRL